MTCAKARPSSGGTASWPTGSGYFQDRSANGCFKPQLITDAQELRQFCAFVTWAAWAFVANRPGGTHSHTNNFPCDPTVGNVATSGALLWSALSPAVLLAGIATVLLAFGKFGHLGWITRGSRTHAFIRPGRPSRGQKALVEYFVVAMSCSSSSAPFRW